MAIQSSRSDTTLSHPRLVEGLQRAIAIQRLLSLASDDEQGIAQLIMAFGGNIAGNDLIDLPPAQ